MYVYMEVELIDAIRYSFHAYGRDVWPILQFNKSLVLPLPRWFWIRYVFRYHVIWSMYDNPKYADKSWRACRGTVSGHVTPSAPLRIARNFSGQHSPQAELLRGNFSQRNHLLLPPFFQLLCCVSFMQRLPAIHTLHPFRLRSWRSLILRRLAYSLLPIPRSPSFGPKKSFNSPIVPMASDEIQEPSSINSRKRPAPDEHPPAESQGSDAPKASTSAPRRKVPKTKGEKLLDKITETPRRLCMWRYLVISFWPCQMPCWTWLPSCRFQWASDTANQGRVSNLRI